MVIVIAMGNVEDCNGECGGNAEINICGECDGDIYSCMGCMNEDACNYDPDAIWDIGEACSYPDGPTCDCNDDPLDGYCDCDSNVLDCNGDCGGDHDLDYYGDCCEVDAFDACGVCDGLNADIGCDQECLVVL